MGRVRVMILSLKGGGGCWIQWGGGWIQLLHNNIISKYLQENVDAHMANKISIVQGNSVITSSLITRYHL